jgi:hypothetical protein
MSLTRGLFGGLIAAPYLITGGAALAPEVLEMTTTAGSPKIMKALDMKMTPSQLAKIGKTAAIQLYGSLALANMDVAAKAEAEVMGACLVAAVGPEAILSNGGEGLSKEFLKGVKDGPDCSRSYGGSIRVTSVLW